MKRIIIALLMLAQFGCQQKGSLEEQLMAEVSLKQETISLYENVMAAWLSNSDDSLKKNDSLYFYFSEFQCTDCIYHILSLIQNHVANDSLKAHRTHLIGYYESDRDFLATLGRYDLTTSGLNYENRQADTFDSEYPLFLLRGSKGSTQFGYQPTMYTKGFSEFYLDNIYERF